MLSILILATILTWGLAQVFIKKGLSRLTPWQTYFVDTVIALLIWIPYGLLQHPDFSRLTLYTLPLMITLGFNVGLYYYVIEKGPISTIGPIVAVYPVFTLILANLFLHESLNPLVYFGIITIISGIVLLSWPEKIGKVKKIWIFLALFNSLGWGIEGAGNKYIVELVGNGGYAIVLGISQAIAVFIWYLFRRPKRILPKLPFEYSLPTLIGIIFWNVGTLTYAYVLENNQASLITPLTNLYIVITVLCSFIFLREKIRKIQGIGIAAIVVGLIIIQIPKKAENGKQSTDNDGQQTTKNIQYSTFNPENSSQKPQINSQPARNALPEAAASLQAGSHSVAGGPTTINLQPNSREKVHVSYVFDGDTIELSDKRRIRYIGINTPELNSKMKIKPECFATNAAEMNKQLVNNQEIEMDKDQTDKDIYGRYLRYVWIDDIFINDFLIRQGFARTEIIAPNTKYATDLKEAEKEAKKDKRGLWGKCQNQSTDNI